MSLLVLIDDYKEQYSPGESITGRVRCSLQSPHYVEVRVQMVREECVFYTASTNESSTKLNRRWKQQIVEIKSTLIRSGVLNPGKHECLFMLTLPNQLPSTYVTDYGYVKFFVKASMSIEENQDQDDIELKVFSPIYLNYMKYGSLTPVSYTDDFRMTKWWCVMENIHMEVNLEKNAFILGETVRVMVNVRNLTAYNISAIKIKLFLVVRLKIATFGDKNVNVYHCIGEDEGSGMNSYRRKGFDLELTIPTNFELPNLERCTYFDQKGVLEVTAVLHDTSKKNPEMKIELELGHFKKFRKIQDTNSTNEPATICPLTYGLASVPSKTLKSNRSKVSPSNVSTHELRDTKIEDPPYPIPPYPTVSDPKLFLPTVPTHHVPENSTINMVPVPAATSDTKSAFTLPYPKENETNYSFNSCPYPLETTKVNETKSIINNPLYSDNVAGPPYPMSEDIQNLSRITPYPPKTDFSYPKNEYRHVKLRIKSFASSSFDNPSKAERVASFSTFKRPSSESYEVLKGSVPYPVSKNPPYPTNDPFRDQAGDKLPLLEDSIQPNYPPYPTEFSASKMPVLPNTLRSSFEEKPLPYPSRSREQSEWPILPPSVKNSSQGDPVLPTQMPMPEPSRMQSVRNPVGNQSRVGNTAPYPTKNSNLGFSEFTSMPMPTQGSLLFCDFIGFTVPTSTPLKGAKPLPPLRTKIHTDVQPSAPLLSEIKTPPIVEITELDAIPHIDEDVSEVGKNVSEVREDIPKVSQDIPKVSEDVPELPTPPISEIEAVEDQDRSVSSFERSRDSSKKKQGQRKRERAIAL